MLAGKECPECGKRYVVKNALCKALAKEYRLPYTEDLDDEPSLHISVRTYNCLKDDSSPLYMNGFLIILCKL